MKKVKIIGAGIGGLSLAILLKHKGFDVTVYEAAEKLKPIGAGIILANNAMQVLKKMNVYDEIHQRGNHISHVNITDEKLNVISSINLAPFEKKYGVKNAAIYRGDLHDILCKKLGYENIVLNKKLVNIESIEDKHKLVFHDGTSIISNSLIGADGINSSVRRLMFNEQIIRNAKQDCWRGVCEYTLPDGLKSQFNEMWYKGKRFGFGQINSTSVYWFALVDEGAKKEKELHLEFNDFGSIVMDIIQQTSKENIFESGIHDIKPFDVWTKKNICLLGDAAHATTPNMGQGACQAIEDAYVLSQLLSIEKNIPLAYEKYNKIRLPKAHSIVKTSWTMGKIAHFKNPIAVWVRNILLKTMPEKLNNNQLDKVFILDTVA